MVDERSAGYMALGMAKQSGQAVAVICTSGTAAANYLPSSIEAYYSGVPVVYITADRPPELIDQWDGQCIRQKGLFGQHIKAEYETPADYKEVSQYSHLARLAFETCMSADPGPVHINVPLRKPIYQRPDQSPELLPVQPVNTPSNNESDLKILQNSLKTNQRILLINGMNLPDNFLPKTHITSIPILSDIVSNRNEQQNIPLWDGMLTGSVTLNSDLKPDLLITTGKMVLSKTLKQYLRKHKAHTHLHVGFEYMVGDPFGTSPVQLRISEASLLQELNKTEADHDYMNTWLKRSSDYKETMAKWPTNVWNEMLITQRILGWIPDKSVLHLANSMSVRYASFVNIRTDLTIFSNRGTSGIDGCTSTAIGSALQTEKPTVLLTGDIAFFYDINGLWLNELPSNLLIIVLNNGGGDIFNLIDGPGLISESVSYQVTPHQRTIEKVASEFGLNYFCAGSFEELHKCLDQLKHFSAAGVLEIKTNPKKIKSFTNVSRISDYDSKKLDHN